MKTTASAEAVEHPSGRVCWNSPWIAPFWVDVLGKPQKNQCVCNSSAPTAFQVLMPFLVFFCWVHCVMMKVKANQATSSRVQLRPEHYWIAVSSGIVWSGLAVGSTNKLNSFQASAASSHLGNSEKEELKLWTQTIRRTFVPPASPCFTIHLPDFHTRRAIAEQKRRTKLKSSAECSVRVVIVRY